MRNESSLNEKSFTDLPRVFFSTGTPHSSRNLPTELESLHEVPIAIIERSVSLECAKCFYYLAQSLGKKNHAPSSDSLR